MGRERERQRESVHVVAGTRELAVIWLSNICLMSSIFGTSGNCYFCFLSLCLMIVKKALWTSKKKPCNPNCMLHNHICRM